MELTKSDIEEINNECPSEQGVFVEPNGIPNSIKEPVVYMRWETGGVRGGGYHSDSNPRPYKNDEPKPKFKALDLVLKKLKPTITYLEFREIEGLIQSSETDDYGDYYGNKTDYAVEFIILSDLLKALKLL